MKIAPGTKKIIKSNYPGLRFKVVDGKEIIEGVFGFKATFCESTNQYVINPQIDDDYTITDNYGIKIESEDDKLPVVYETKNQIPEACDYHKNQDGSLCLAGPFDYLNDFTFDKFLDTLLLQFLYDQSFKKKFGYWPRGEYSHGPLGLFENYYDRLGRIPQLEERCFAVLLKNKSKKEYLPYIELLSSKKQIKGHHFCICGSKKQYRKCHDRVFKGLWNLQKYVLENDLENHS